MKIKDGKVWIGATRKNSKSPWIWNGTGDKMTYDNTLDCKKSGTCTFLPHLNICARHYPWAKSQVSQLHNLSTPFDIQLLHHIL